MKQLLNVAAPAKLNLFLHINGQRPDGYHLLQSVFMLIDWCDTLHFDLRIDGGLSREDIQPAKLPPEDLCLKAARALQQATSCDMGAHIRLEKRIPAEAGMGGGSSDAATCLIALNRLWGLGLKRSELAAIGLGLGADVPFFIGGRNAWVEGVGEQLTPISLPPARFAVIKPAAGASTQAIFSAPNLQRATKTATIQGFAANNTHGLLTCDLQALLAFGHNDLQPVAQALCPDVVRCLDWLSTRGLRGRMTGSGTAVFAQMLQAVDLSGAPDDWVVRECSNMDAHPLLDWCTD
ncbi:4-(cytidine 5'-diphospho)-2-C-methyl-D-erythritol kinase [Hydrogenophaga sp. A37]|uniref:4-(cytidine 5'-diphospho)-2-C-methyl-D-erythritol kinase n=1 Tax=Hydrogenophaga sp. A37 TaxID=1945864 RepID=UPI000987C6A5|nr:4-(cytidine 5'-diphospho)-2-C-methyl-D-erythritol kinase [Hydrogenophaga sp. A37]OOG81921.1 4-(cytidine 5'-diphospho)-2-C-methyl-D-erythritol kinase [Hydrogenophaga sp. A37]